MKISTSEDDEETSLDMTRVQPKITFPLVGINTLQDKMHTIKNCGPFRSNNMSDNLSSIFRKNLIPNNFKTLEI